MCVCVYYVSLYLNVHIYISSNIYYIQYYFVYVVIGSKPRQLEVLAQSKPSVQRHVSVYRGAQDFKDLLEIVNCSQNIAIIGGGFLGSELACALTRRCNLLVLFH